MTNILAAYSTWLHTLPLYVQPVVQGFTPSLPVWLAVAVYERRWIAKHGAPPPAKKISGWLMLPVVFGLFYLKGRYPQIRAVLDYPDRHWPGWHLHWWQMVIGCVIAGFVAKGLGTLYAALFLRRPASRQSHGGGGFPAFPAGWEGFTRERNYHSEWEEE